jgi:hypothetical protein
MRDNGLTAAAYASLGGIDPLIAEPVLTALAEAGIAAYAAEPGEQGPAEAPSSDQPTDEPAESPVQSEGSAKGEGPAKAEAPARAEIAAGQEEIFVDAASAEHARAVIERSTEEAEWKSLVEQFNEPSAPGHEDSQLPRWPASEDVDQNSYEPLIDVPAGLNVGEGRDRDEEAEDERPTRDNDPHDHFVPPEPPRGPRLDWISRAAWLGMIGGPLLLILAAVFGFGESRITLLAVVGFVAGFLTLVIRMKDRLPPDDTPDDGAVI